MKIVILCGGRGTRIRDIAADLPKPMIPIGSSPILWHIMKTYSHYGFNEFILCLGYKGEVIREYFYNYEILSSDFTIELGTRNIQIHNEHPETEWKITLVDTGLNAMTGARVKRIERFIDGDTFMLTYGDGVTDLDIRKLLQYHKSHDKIGTVTAVRPPSQYGELTIHEDQVLSFSEKEKEQNSSINGGYFVFRKDIFEYLEDNDACILERGPLEKLAFDGELKVFQHKGFWQCMDTNRDHKFLSETWGRGDPSWKVW